MGILEKLEMLDLTEEEREKAKGKFLASLSLVGDEEFRSSVAALEKEGVRITKARDIKVTTNSSEDISKKFSILDEIHETELYRQNPSLINRNVIDIYKKIKYCNQLGKPYKREDGTYESFLFNELLWQKEFNGDLNMNTPHIEEAKPVIENPEPVVHAVETIPTMGQIVTHIEPSDEHLDIKEYMLNSNDTADLEAKTTDFATVKKELEASLQELNNLKSMDDNSFDEISFNDLEPESYGTRRAA